MPAPARRGRRWGCSTRASTTCARPTGTPRRSRATCGSRSPRSARPATACPLHASRTTSAGPRSAPKPREASALVRAEAAEVGAVVVELGDLGGRTLVLPDAVHPTALGQAVIAERAAWSLRAAGIPVPGSPLASPTRVGPGRAPGGTRARRASWARTSGGARWRPPDGSGDEPRRGRGPAVRWGRARPAAPAPAHPRPRWPPSPASTRARHHVGRRPGRLGRAGRRVLDRPPVPVPRRPRRRRGGRGGRAAGARCVVTAHERIDVGPQARLGDEVVLLDFDHVVADPDVPVRRQGLVTAAVRIGRGAPRHLRGGPAGRRRRAGRPASACARS